MSRDEGYLIARTDQLSVARNSHTKLSYFADRTDLGGAKLSHHSTDQQEQRARIPHFHASRKNIDGVEGSDQNDCPPVQHSRYPTEAGSTQLEYMHRSEQTEGSRRQGQVEPQYSSQKLARWYQSTRERVAGQHTHGFPLGRRKVEKVQNAWYSSGAFKKTDLGTRRP